MEELLGLLLGELHLFYPLLIASLVLFLYGFMKRSFVMMVLSGLFLFPDTWYFSGYPPFPWAKFIPLLHVMIALIFIVTKKKEATSS